MWEVNFVKSTGGGGEINQAEDEIIIMFLLHCSRSGYFNSENKSDVYWNLKVPYCYYYKHVRILANL